MRRTRRAGFTGSVRRVADPFRRALKQLFDGTATGRFDEVTAVEMTAVTARRTTTGGYIFIQWQRGHNLALTRVYPIYTYYNKFVPSNRVKSGQICKLVTIYLFFITEAWLAGISRDKPTSADGSNVQMGPQTSLLNQNGRQQTVAHRLPSMAVPSPVPSRTDILNLNAGTETGRVCPSPTRRNDGRARRRDGAQSYALYSHPLHSHRYL